MIDKRRVIQLMAIILLACGNVALFSQSGPGGIGNVNGSDGQPELYLWLLPDSLVLTDGNDVLTWNDFSGKNQDLTAVSATAPVFQESALNGHNYLEFSKSNNRIVKNPFDMPTEAVAVFMVLKTNTTAQAALMSYNGSGAENNYLFLEPRAFKTFIDGNANNSGQAINNDVWNVFSHQWRNSDGRLLMHLNGSEVYSTTHRSGVSLFENGSLAIGGEQDGVNTGYDAGQAFEGDIAEIIMFGSSMKQAQRTVVENYLAQKYGLDANLSFDYYVPEDGSYVQGLTGMGKESDGTTILESDGLVVSQNGDFNNGEYVFAAHNNTTNTVNVSPGVMYSEVEATWLRDWYVDKTGTVDAKIAFDLSEGIDGDFPSNIDNYRLMYKASLSDSYDTITVAGRGVQNGDQIYFAVNDGDFNDGYYTLGTVDQTNSPLEGVAGRTWYTLIGGKWNDWEVWTLDPSGALPNNPEKLTPTTSPTANADKVVVLTGKTVTVEANNKVHSSLKVDGRLDLQATSGHSFGEISGRGRILLSGDNFPSGDATDFITKGQGEGTVEYYGAGFELNSSREYYNLVVNMATSSSRLTLLNDYVINGELRIKKGELQINNSIATTALNITTYGNVAIEADGSILTGDADARHQFNFYGDFTNNGTVKFTNRSAALYNSQATDGIVDANFLNIAKNQVAFINGPATFYRIEINKGIDDTYELVLEATNPSYFNIFGFAAENHGSSSQLASNNNALGLVSGTVRVKSNISIPVLSTASNYNVSESARLWVDGGSVHKNSGTAIVPYGKILVSAGLLEAKIKSGITLRANGLVKVEGGTVNINQLRTSTLGSSNIGGYVQSGGIVNVLGVNSESDYYCFNLTYPGNVFNMSGGTLHIHQARGKGGVFIASDAVNQNITGGTVIFEINNSNDFAITSKAPFWNVTLRNSSGGSGEHILSEGTDVGSSNENLAAQSLRVMKDLTIEMDAFLNHAGNDIHVGRSFFIDENAQRRTFDNTGFNDSSNDFNIGYLFDPAIPNNTIFDGSEDGEFYIEYNNSDGFEEYFHNLTVRKTKGSKVTLVCSEKKSAQYLDDTNKNDWFARLLRVENSLSVESGILDQGQSSFRLYGPLNIKADAECGVWIPGTTHPWAVMMIKDADLNINTEKGAVLGNIKMNPNPATDIISFSSDVYIKRIAYFFGRINLQSHQLKLDYLHHELTTNNYDISNGGSNSEMFYSSGNVSDGSLLLYVPAGTPDGTAFPFPLGVFGKYTPSEIVLSDVVDDGYIQIIPVDKELQTTNLGGGDVLSYYWKVDYQDFDNIPTVDRLRFFYNNSDISGSEANYVAGKVQDVYPFSRVYEDEDVPENEGVQTSNNRITFNGQTDAGFSLEKASYTAGVPARFTGSPKVFYLRANNDWNNGNTWSYSRGGAPAGDYPKAGDVAVIRRLGSNYSGLVTVSGSEQAAAVIFDDENGWASGSPRIIFSSSNNYAAYNSVFDVVDVADTHQGGTLDYNTHGAVVQYNINQNYSNESTSLNFDGNDDYVAIQNFSYNGNSYQEMTVEAWIKTDDGSDQIIASFDRNQYWRLEINGEGAGTGQVGFDIMTDAGQLDFGGSTRIDDGQWHHVAAVFDNGAVYIYVDGVLDNSTNHGNTFGTAALTRFGFVGVGSEADTYNGSRGPTSYFDGNISEVRIWNVARTVTEIQNSRNSLLAGTETGLEVYYRMNGTGSDNNTSDDSSNSNDGSLFGFSLPGAWATDHPWGSSFPGGDFGDFNRYPNALVIYQWEGASGNADVTLSAEATEYPQMWFAGGNGNRKIRFPDTDVTIHGGFTIPGNVIIVGNGESDNTITMEQNVNIGSPTLGYGQFLFPGNATGSVTLDVKKDVRIRGGENSTIGIENAAASNTMHKLIVAGNLNIENTGGKLRLGDGDLAKSNVEMELQGASDNVFTNSYASETPQFYRIIMNKGLDATNSFSFNSDFLLTGTTNGVGIAKALELQNGRIIINNNAVNLNLSTGDDLFYIPGTAALEIAQGQVKVSGGSGILLDGLLDVSGGIVDMSGGNNYIQYSASGKAAIDVSAGSLIVGSQIRRGLTSSEGVLNYTQSGGTVIVGNNAAPENNRGVFEVLNEGSHFEFTGGDFYVARAQNNPAMASFYLDPATSAFDPAASLQFGYTNTPANEQIGLYSTVDLPNVVVDNSSAKNPELKMWTIPLTISNDLTIQSGASFNANGLDLHLYGNLTVNGSFIANGNTTSFDSNTGSEITGVPVFYNLQKNNGGTLTLNNDITVENMYDQQAGTLSDGGNTMTVEGDVFFNGNHTWGGSGRGIYLAGESLQNLQGNGAFGKLSINNPEGVFVPEGNTISIDGALQLENGVFDIGKNLLELSVDADIIEANAFSEENMIQTNISFTDNGIKKWFPAISSTTTFIYPIGSAGKYTPVEFNIEQLDAGSSIRVKAADEIHPTVQEDAEPCNEITDKNNALDYHWVLETNGVNNFSGSASMKYYPDDVLIDNSLSGTSYDITDYATARLLRNSTDWNKYDANSFDESNELLMFYFTNTDDNGVSGDYTAGIEDQTGSCEGAIPDKVPTYITIMDGEWGDATIWAPYPDGGIAPAGGPRGAAVIIAHDVNLTSNYKISYKTEIRESGRLSVGSTFGHRLGEVTGSGTLSLLRGDLPAGVYEEFLSASGGTLEYGGSESYDILSENTYVNNLRFIGSGDRRLSNLNIQVFGNIELDGASLINEHNKTLSLKGDFAYANGSFVAGTADAKLVLNGSEVQTLSGLALGGFSGTNSFNRLTVHNPAGVVFALNADVKEVLTLSAGRVIVDETAKFRLVNYSPTAISGASATKYIDGPLYKQINTGASFDFPLGNENRYGNIRVANVTAEGMWRAQYHSSSPSGAGLSTGSKEAPVQYVSSNEYWNIEAPADGATAEVTLRWDASSGVNPAESGLRGVQWLTDKWHVVTLSNISGTSTAGTAKTNPVLSFNANTGGNYVTFGAITIPAYTWTGATSTDWFTATNWINSTVPSASANTTIGAVTNLPEIAGASVAQVNNLVIETGAILTLNPGGKLTVNGDLAIADVGGLIMKNTTDVNGLASLITNGSISGEARIELEFPYDEWYYVSHPIANAQSDIYAILNGDNSFSTSEAWINVHRANRWYRIGTGVNLGLMEGVSNKYRPADLSDHVVSYTGALNNGSIPRSLANEQYYLLGNPYPSAINWQSDAGWVRNNVGGTIWYRTRVNSEMAFVTYNRFAEPGARAAIYPDQGNFGDEEALAYIPPLQSVWVSSLGGASVSIDNNARSHVPAATFLKSSSSAGNTGNVVRIIAENASSYDGAVLYFSENSEEGIDRGDSEKMFNESVAIPEIYTRVGDRAMAINGLPLITESSRTIPLSVRNRQEGEVTLRFDLQYYSGVHAPYLEDRETGAFINLLQEPSYSYTVTETGDKHDRFALHFYNVTTDLESPNEEGANSGSSINIKSLAGKVLVSVGTELLQDGNGVVEIYTIEGRKISEVPARTTRTLVILPNESGVYIIRAKFGSQVRSEQVIGVMK